MPAARDRIPAVARQSKTLKLLRDRRLGARRVGEEDDAAAFIAPTAQPFGDTRIELYTIVNDAPQIAQDQPVFRIERIEETQAANGLAERQRVCEA